MNYCCARCQKLHPVSDIAADLRTLCGEQVKKQLDAQLDDIGTQDAKLFETVNTLIGFVQTDRSAFVFSVDQLKKLSGMTKPEQMNGTLKLSMSWLVDRYRDQKKLRRERIDSDEAKKLDELDTNRGNETLYEDDISLSLSPVSSVERKRFSITSAIGWADRTLRESARIAATVYPMQLAVPRRS